MKKKFKIIAIIVLLLVALFFFGFSIFWLVNGKQGWGWFVFFGFLALLYFLIYTEKIPEFDEKEQQIIHKWKNDK